jgi:hypothetical protein
MEIKPLTGNLLESPIPEQQVQQEAAPATQAAPTVTAAPSQAAPQEEPLEVQKRKTRGALKLLDLAMKAHRRNKSKTT